jgi:integrase
MFKIYYKIRAIKKDGTGTVYVIARTKAGEEFARTTGVNVLPQNFNTGSGKVTKDLLAPEKNTKIQALASRLETACRNATSNGLELTKDIIEMQFEYDAKHSAAVDEADKAIGSMVLAGVEMVEAEIALLEFQLAGKRQELKLLKQACGEEELVVTPVDLFTSRIEEYIQLHKSSLDKKTLDLYTNVCFHVKAFRPRVAIQGVNLAFLTEFQDYLVATPTRQGTKRRNGSIRAILGRLKTVFTYFAADLNLSTAFFTRLKLVSDKQNENIFYLTAQELEHIANVDLKADLQQRVRDQFLLLCETGLRHIDAGVTRADIFTVTSTDGNTYEEIRLQQEKTDTVVSIPLTPRAKAILEQNNYSFTPINVKHFNQALQQICKKVTSLQADFVVTNYNGAKGTKETKPKYLLVTSKVARKTFTNTCFELGVSETTVAAWLGHANTKMVQKHYKAKGDIAKREAHKILLPA